VLATDKFRLARRPNVRVGTKEPSVAVTKGTPVLKPNDVYVTGSGSAFGARIVPSEEVDRAYGMPEGKLKNRAGIVSVSYAGENEDESSLGAQAAQRVLQECDEDPSDLDWVLAASETHHAFPSLAAILHARLGVREKCSSLDVGSGCVALVQALAVGQSLLEAGKAKKVLVVTADLHSRTLAPGRAQGEFGGLFGDGASAFLLSTVLPAAGRLAYRLGEFIFGCATQYSEAIRVSNPGDGPLDVHFDGEGLSRAAVNRMVKVLEEIQQRSGICRAEVGAFATHQPNPRLVTLLAKQMGVPVSAFPLIAATRGNLGSSTCGAALDAAMQQASQQTAEERKPLFLASLGPGLLFGGGWMVPAVA
jgi:3-oxoacyl-[acyl-carrier-protein] synthase III